MSVSVTMPALGESVTEGTVTRWLKQVGDTVAADEPLLEVSTDKVDTEIPSPAAGILLAIRVGEDETIAVGRAHGIVFPPTLVDDTLALIRSFPATSKSSMLEDFERGRRLELPWLSGAVVRLGKAVGVPTPTHQFIAAVLQPFVNGVR